MHYFANIDNIYSYLQQQPNNEKDGTEERGSCCNRSLGVSLNMSTVTEKKQPRAVLIFKDDLV
ncbi:hypothetical protein T09_6883 [Trichinella sp. T9]|nr:hypothetical protein T09_6883 [Trichinella sp. T9]